MQRWTSLGHECLCLGTSFETRGVARLMLYLRETQGSSVQRFKVTLNASAVVPLECLL